MNSTKRLIALVLIAALVPVPLHPTAFADDSDIFGANIQPNVLIMLDSSLSMTDNVNSESYNSATTYTVVNTCGSDVNAPCTSVKVYRSPSWHVYLQYANDIASVPNASARTALSTVGYWSGKIGGSTVSLYVGNYINYQYAGCVGLSCPNAKMDIAKRVINRLFDNVTGVRFGVMKFTNNGSPGQGGGAMVAEIGTLVATMKTAVNGITPAGYTPLGEFLYDAGRYYKGLPFNSGAQYPSPIQSQVGECQPNFVILVSDGLQNGSKDVRTEATLRFTEDHASSYTGTQNVIVHTVGFGIGASEPGNVVAANDVLRTASQNGGGQFYETNNEAELEAALTDAIRRIVQATFTFATPVLPTTSTTGSSKAYLAAFQSDPSRPFWKGYLKAYQRTNGVVPVDGNGVPLSSALVWDAGQVLSTIASSSRTINTVVTGSLTTFQKTNAAITVAMLGAGTTTERDKIIDFTRGVDAYDEDKDGNSTEDRSWKLGDIFHSTPVLVTPPVLALNDSSYQSFKSAKASRTSVLIAGANDGMLHAFRESDGSELWAFIPPDLLGSLKNLTVTSGDHPYLVDSSPVAADIKVSGSWSTIVVFGLRRGGRSYYALDITDTTAPSFLWSFTDAKMGETWSEPAIGKVKLGGVDKFVAIVGGGYDTGANNASGKALFVIDLATGAKLWEYYNDTTLDDRQYMNFSIPANPTAVDLNSDGYIDRVYIGDVGGQLWKFDLSAGSTTSWTGKRLFVAATGQSNPPAAGEFYPTQAIYGAPAVTLGPDLKVWVLFGTGDRNHPNNTTAPNHFYGIKDTTDMTNGSTVTGLADVTDFNGTAAAGWSFDLNPGEKVLAAANVFNNNVLFSTFTPTSTVTCTSGGGTAKLYAVQVTTGYAGIDFSTGLALTSTGASTTRATTIGAGIASMPVIVITPPASPGGTTSTSAITATSNQQLPANAVPPPAFLKQVRSWIELVQ